VILPDVNSLVYAYRREADRHELYARWLGEVVAGADELALADHCLTGFLRIVTNPRIFSDPAPNREALRFVKHLRTARRARVVSSTHATWRTMASLIASDAVLRGNLLPDAYLAALCISHGCRLATADRGFARFPGLRHFDPVSQSDESVVDRHPGDG
jgi:toxin-antitoxin system PIN domain toxin